MFETLIRSNVNTWALPKLVRMLLPENIDAGKTVVYNTLVSCLPKSTHVRRTARAGFERAEKANLDDNPVSACSARGHL